MINLSNTMEGRVIQENIH